MQKYYEDTIESMINNNKNFCNALKNEYYLNEEDKTLTIIQLYFVFFYLFKKDLEIIEIDKSLKEAILNNDYVIFNNKILINNREIKMEELKSIFNLIIEYKNNKLDKKIIPFPNNIQLNKDKKTNCIILDYYQFRIDDKTIEEKDKEAHALICIQEKNNDIVKEYLSRVKSEHDHKVIHNIQRLISYLEGSKDNRFEKKTISYISLLLNLYPTFIYGKNKISFDYSELSLPEDIKLFKLTYELDEDITRKREIIDRCERRRIYIERNKKYNISLRKNKAKQRFIEAEKRHINNLEMDTGIELYELLNSPKVYNYNFINNLLKAIESGTVNLSNQFENRKHELDIYHVTDNGVEFAAQTELDQLLEFINYDELIRLLNNNKHIKRLQAN